MADRFYVNFPLHVGEVLIQGAEVHHLATVRRFRVGGAVTLFNGDGSDYPATITEIGKREVRLEVIRIDNVGRELTAPLEVAAAVPKGDREDFLIEKLTELGVTRFVPLTTERSVVVPKVERLERAVIEASKQCERNVLMKIGSVTPWSDYVSAAPTPRWIAHVDTSNILDMTTRPQAVAIGPEGGFTESEVTLAIANGWQIVGLGPRTLRVETAAMALAAYLSLSAPSA